MPNSVCGKANGATLANKLPNVSSVPFGYVYHNTSYFPQTVSSNIVDFRSSGPQTEKVIIISVVGLPISVCIGSTSSLLKIFTQLV